nr:non-ribosomal peptide synthetase [Pelomonas sp. BJYL3]
MDRKALPAPADSDYAARGYEAPQGEVETALAAIWAELLQLERVGRHDNFFELGGHSLMAVTLVERMRQAGLHADVRALFLQPTLAQLAEAVGGASLDVVVPPNLIPEGATAITPPMLTLVQLDQAAIDSVVAGVEGGAANVQDIYPLAPLQEGILFHHLMEKEGDPYLLPSLLGFASRERLERFVGALQQVIDRHDILRTGMAWEGLEQPVQVVRRQARLALDFVELDPAQGDVAQQLQQRFDPRHYRLDVRRAPLLEAHAAQDPEQGRWVLLVLAHHLAIDHTTLELLVEEAQIIEQGRLEALLAPAPFRNFVAQARLGVSQAEHEAFFRRMLGGIDEPTTPFGLGRAGASDFDLAEHREVLATPLSARLREQARRHGVSAASLVHLAWALVLARSTGRREVVFGTVLFGRMHSGDQASRTLGMFINTLPVRIDIDELETGLRLAEVHSMLAELLRHEHAPLALAQRCSAVDAQSPLFTSLLNYRHSPLPQPTPTEDGQGAADEGMELLGASERTNYPLTLAVDDLGQDFLLTAQCREGLAPQRVCAHMVEALSVLAQALETGPELPVACLEPLPAAEREQVLRAFNATDRVYEEGERCLHHGFEAQVKRTPDAPALSMDGEVLSYAQLNARANRLAHHLSAAGLAPDDRVGVCAQRSIDLVVALYAVLKAGAAYVPFDPTHPPERLRHMLEDATPVVMLMDDAGEEALSQAGATAIPALCLHLQRDAVQWAQASAEDPLPTAPGSDHLAYVIFTSGSTGRPKGAMNTHRAVVNRLLWMQQAYALDATDVVLQKTPFSFDVSVWEFFWPLMVGARLELARPEGHKDPLYLAELIDDAGVTTLHFVPSMLQVFLDHAEPGQGRRLRHVVCSGEALPAGLARRALSHWPSAGLHNLYGPTEAAVDVSAWSCRADDARAFVPIGRPIANTRLYILDAALRPQPLGVAGEIHIGGVQVGRGYLNRPELTEDRFIADPFEDRPGARMYKTGDLGRWLEDGSIEYLGRNDFQVKIRGLRIELGEIEACLAELVPEVVVLAREDEPGQQRLVAYYTGEAEAGQLQAHAASTLPAYMVPSAYVRLPELPLNANGKLDRKALPAPDADALLRAAYEAPQGETEIALAAIWAELLQLDRVSRHDNFFELGGHSLMAVTLIERMRREGLHAEVRALLTAASLADLARLVGRESSQVQVPPNLIPDGATAITPEMLSLVALDQAAIDRVLADVEGGAANVQDIYPLAPLQEGILFHHLMHQQGDPYLLPTVLGFPDRQRLDQFLAALQQVIARHDILRTGIAWQGLEQAVQVVRRQAPLNLEIETLDAGAGPGEQQLRARFDPRLHRIDVARAPLLRAHAAEDPASGRWLLMLLAHHLVIDHTTVELLTREAFLIEQGRADELQAPVPFRNFVAQARLGSSRQAHEEFFTRMLGDIDEPTAPFDVLDVQGDGSQIDEHRRLLPNALATAVRQQARRLGVGTASMMHLAWALVLARVTGRRDVVFGTVLFGRMQGGEQADRALGLFINTLPLRVSVDDGALVHSLRKVHRDLARLLHHEHASLALAQRCSRVGTLAPLFTSLLNYRHAPAERSSEADGFDWDIEDFGGEERSNYPLGVSVDDLGDALAVTVQALSPIDAGRVAALLEHSLLALTQALELSPSMAVQSLDILPEQERAWLLAQGGVGRAAQDVPALCLHERFERQAQARPRSEAVVHGELRLSYGELNARANQLARHLRALGAGPDRFVGVCAGRSPELVLAQLAIWKTGAAYLPLDPAYPADRLRYMLEDSRPMVLLCQGEAALQTLEAAGWQQPVIDLQADAAGWSAESEANLSREEIGLQMHHLAYLIYTSGSTGQPKGVMNEHLGLSNLVDAQAEAFGVRSDSRLLQFASPSFDASISELALALASGATLCLADPEEMMPGRALLGTLQRLAVSHVTLPPSALAACEEAGMPFAAHTLIVAGEAIAPKAAQAWAARLRLINAYGPTETTVCATTHHCLPQVPMGSAVPIGRPIANVSVYLLDAQRRLVPAGATGEIYIGGIGVARGYLHREDLTAERFLDDPFCPGGRMYRSGDLGRWLPDGTIEFLGRNDQQVKVRGFRVELGEVEARLAGHGAVREVCVTARADSMGALRLLAYYTAHGSPAEAEAETAALRQHAAAALPHYMVPSAFVRLEAFPLTPNGKIDRRALPAPGAEGASALQPPQGAMELALARIWADLLELDQVGRDSHFFELGGHSLLAVQLMARIRGELDVELPLAELYLHPTLEALARHMENRQPMVAALTAVRAQGSQRPLFVMHALDCTGDYAVELARRLDPDLPVYALPAPGLREGEQPLRTIEDMARHYIRALRSVQAQGPYRLAAWSAGGQVAYEVARQLMVQGETVSFLGLIDTLYRAHAIVDAQRQWLGAGQHPLERREWAFLLVMLQHDLGMPAREVKRLAKLDSMDAVLAKLVEDEGLPPSTDLAGFRRRLCTQNAFVEAIEAYQAQALDLRVHLFAASESLQVQALGWDQLLGSRLSIVRFKASHQSIMKTPVIDELSAALQAALHSDVQSRETVIASS